MASSHDTDDDIPPDFVELYPNTSLARLQCFHKPFLDRLLKKKAQYEKIFDDNKSGVTKEWNTFLVNHIGRHFNLIGYMVQAFKYEDYCNARGYPTADNILAVALLVGFVRMIEGRAFKHQEELYRIEVQVPYRQISCMWDEVLHICPRFSPYAPTIAENRFSRHMHVRTSTRDNTLILQLSVLAETHARISRLYIVPSEFTALYPYIAGTFEFETRGGRPEPVRPERARACQTLIFRAPTMSDYSSVLDNGSKDKRSAKLPKNHHPVVILPPPASTPPCVGNPDALSDEDDGSWLVKAPPNVINAIFIPVGPDTSPGAAGGSQEPPGDEAAEASADATASQLPAEYEDDSFMQEFRELIDPPSSASQPYADEAEAGPEAIWDLDGKEELF